MEFNWAELELDAPADHTENNVDEAERGDEQPTTPVLYEAAQEGNAPPPSEWDLAQIEVPAVGAPVRVIAAEGQGWIPPTLIHWRMSLQGVMARVFDYFYPRGHLAMTEEDWVAVREMIPTSLRPDQLLPILMGTLRTIASNPGARFVLEGWATRSGRVLAVTDQRDRLTAPAFCPEERINWVVYGMLVRTVNLFLCQRGPYDDHLTFAAMDDLGLEGAEARYGVDATVAVLTHLAEVAWYWPTVLRNRGAGVAGINICAACCRPRYE